MNDQTIKLIQELSDKLGTTAEHLWGVLIRQAPISAATNLICCLFVFSMIPFIWRKLSAWEPEDSFIRDCGKPILVFVLTSFFAIFAINFLCGLSTIIAGFVNPEYWALKQILK